MFPPDPRSSGCIHASQGLAKSIVQIMADALNELPAACREAFLLNKLQDTKTNSEFFDSMKRK